MTVHLVVALCIVWMPALLGVAGLCLYARLADEARADDLLPTDGWEPATETAICEALTIADTKWQPGTEILDRFSPETEVALRREAAHRRREADDFFLWQVENGWASA